VTSTDVITVDQQAGIERYVVFITAVSTGSFNITFATINNGQITEQPVFSFAVIKAVTS
jgi:hypothetical protein